MSVPETRDKSFSLAAHKCLFISILNIDVISKTSSKSLFHTNINIILTEIYSNCPNYIFPTIKPDTPQKAVVNIGKVYKLNKTSDHGGPTVSAIKNCGLWQPKRWTVTKEK